MSKSLQDDQRSDDGRKSSRTIIVNQIPLTTDRKKFISIFTRYGKIDNIYLSRKPKVEMALSSENSSTTSIYTISDSDSNSDTDSDSDSYCNSDSDSYYNSDSDSEIDWYDSRMEESAHITFHRRRDAHRVWSDSLKTPIIYNDCALMITLASDDYSPVSSLDDNCLLHIFSYLTSLPDRFRLEGVSRRWQALALKSWSSMRSIVDGKCDTVYQWKMIISRAGPTVRNLSLNLKGLYRDVTKGLSLVEKHCPKLVKFSCTADYWSMGKSRPVFSKSQNLRFIFLDFYGSMWKDCGIILNGFPTILEGLHFCCHGDIKTPVDLSRYPNLQILELQEMAIGDNEMFGLEYLKKLRMVEFYGLDLSRGALANLTRFPKLESLKLVGRRIGDSILLDVLKNQTTLRCLDVRWSRGITDLSFECIKKLPQLQVLSMVDLPSVTDQSIRELSSLKSLNCTECCHLTDDGIKMFLDSTSAIQELMFSSSWMSIKSVLSARDWVTRTGRTLMVHIDFKLARAFRKLKLPPIQGFTLCECKNGPYYENFDNGPASQFA